MLSLLVKSFKNECKVYVLFLLDKPCNLKHPSLGNLSIIRRCAKRFSVVDISFKNIEISIQILTNWHFFFSSISCIHERKWPIPAILVSTTSNQLGEEREYPANNKPLVFLSELWEVSIIVSVVFLPVVPFSFWRNGHNVIGVREDTNCVLAFREYRDYFRVFSTG